MKITEERKRRVIDLYFNQHKSYAEIAKIEKILPRDIHAIINEELARRQKYKDQQGRQESSSKAYELFSQGKTPLQVAISLNIRQSEATKYYREYWKLRGLRMLDSLFIKTNGKIWPLWKLYQELIEKRGMSIAQVVNAVDTAIHKLPHMDSLYRQAKEQVEKMQHTIQRLVNDIESRKNKISILDKIAFSCEQDCKRKELAIQELDDKKDILEKLIMNMLNGEGYSKVRQVAKENVKAVLSDNKILLSASFAAIIQTLKDDPELINLIYNTPTANDGKQHKDNDDNNNIIKHLQSNTDTLLHLAKKNYENLVEALTNNTIDSGFAFSSNLT